MKIFESIINHKISTATASEILKYADQFQISITKKEAEQIAGYLNGKQINIFNSSERSKLLKEIAKITSPETAREVNRLFLQFMK
ncbi:DUF2624 domain-containing protein [Bacillus sp. 03113]|uniref:DUF2624 domain-containing protein n=1 Tax=Bacillus sp. 03113 TaxID=2578211 RepID=UPI001141B9A3|nr:DUF2624 domain-containing protein [Bacillus sp. 03113]